MAERCGATETVHIESQYEQIVACRLAASHPGHHEAQILDSDDNPIPYRWPNDDARPWWESGGDDHDQS